MALFSYSAFDGANVLREGVLEGVDKVAVARKLMQQGLRPVDIKSYNEQNKRFSLEMFRKKKITSADIDFFTKQIALLLDAGLSLDGSLRVMKQHSNKPAFAEFAGEMERKLKEGKSFSQALADYPYFSSMYINIVKAGEEGGILPQMLSKMSEYQQTFQELRSFIISASIYPLILLLVGISAILLLIVKILPRFEVLFQDSGKELPMNVKIMMDFSKAISGHPFIAMAAVLGPIALAVYYFRTEDGKRFLDHLAIRTPLVNSFVSSLETTRIFRTLEVLVENGVHLATALKISSGVAMNREYKRVLNKATDALKEGRQVGKKLKSEGLLPELAADLLSIGEESGKVGKVCGQIANHFETDLRTRVKRLIAFIEPMFILGIAIVAGYVVVSMLMVIMNINEIAG